VSYPDVTAAVLVIGNEILSGRTQDVNLIFLARRLNDLGVRLREARVVTDDEAAIVAALNECRVAYDYVFTTGGIGPTHDDITTASVACAFGVEVIRHPEAVALLQARYASTDLNDARLKMAETPAGALLIENPVSAAPGYQVDNVFVLAGVPSIMRAMFESLAPRLRGGDPLLSRCLKTYLTEGTLASGLGGIQARFPAVSIGSYPFFREGRYGVSLVLRATDPDLLARAAEATRDLVDGLGGEAVEQAEP